MATAHIHLTAEESQALQALAQRTGKTQDELLREVVEQLLSQFQHDERRRLLR